jgi:phosphate transport system permease protein
MKKDTILNKNSNSKNNSENFNTWRKINSIIGVSFLRFFILLSIIFLLIFLIIIFAKGFSKLSFSFLIEFPKDGMTSGGILPAIYGTFMLTVLSLLFALPLGVFSAIYLSEYAKPEWLVNIVRMAINTLAGVPSIVFGLFGLAVFVPFVREMFGLGELLFFGGSDDPISGKSIIAGALTLGVLILPIIINASEEAIKAIPRDFREASLALGATKRETIMKVVIPSALPSILTGAIISVGRAAGETAPILFTAGAFFTGFYLPGVFEETPALPYHIYALMTEGTHSDKQVPIAYATAIVLLLLVLGINLVAIIIRYNMRRKKKW